MWRVHIVRAKSPVVTSLAFRLPNSWGLLEVSRSVLNHFESHKQHSFFSREAGGQLFASFSDPSVMNIVDVTGPRPSDKRTTFSYCPDRIAERVEIKERFAKDLHFVGDWHTHYQRVPQPSGRDEQSIRELVRASSHDLAGFVLIVVGQAMFPAGLHVSFHSKSESMQLTPIAT